MKAHLSILIIEDDKYCRLNLREILRPFGITDEAVDYREAIEKLSERFYDIVVTDIELGGIGSGADLVPVIVRKGSHCIVVSSYEGDDTIEQVYLMGAKHYLSKFKLKDQLPVYIQKFLLHQNSQFEKLIQDKFITQDEGLLDDLRKLYDVNWKNQSLFISGATGTGKSLLGKLIHEMTHSEAPFIHLNCSEVNENLIESELFGHEKGAFTGAENKKEGKLKLAHGGTLFLDEVGTMPMVMQQKLLKALDEKTFYPVGSSTPQRSEFTLVTATCEDIHDKIKKKEFREDLFFRISGFSFHLKSLSERPEDIELLINHFKKTAPRKFVIKPDAISLLRKLPWNGNVRELNKVCERFSQSINGVIDLDFVNQLPNKSTINSTGDFGYEDYILQNGLRSLISSIEKRAVEDSLKRNNGKITACIKELKISSSAFYRILQDHQLHF